MNGIESSPSLNNCSLDVLLPRSISTAKLLMSGNILTVRSRYVVRHVLAGVNKVEARHLPHHDEDVINTNPRRFMDGLCQAHGEVAPLLLASSDTNIARDYRHGVPPSFCGQNVMRRDWQGRAQRRPTSVR